MNGLRLLLLLSLAGPLSAGTTRLTWMHSGLPAASLDVRLDGGAVVRSDAGGTVDVGASRSIVVIDPRSGRELAAGTVGGEGPIRVPEPIRVRGRATGAGGALTVHVGDGPRVDPVERLDRELGSRIRQPEARGPLGIAAAPAPLRWTSLTADAGAFTSGWVVADPPPVVLLQDERGHAALVEVTIGDGVRPHATVDLGSIALEPSAILEIAPDGGGASSAELHVRSAAIGSAEAAARELGVLDRRDRRLFELLLLGRPYFLAADAGARIAIPRWLTRATVVLRDSWEERAVEREVSFMPGEVTRIDWPEAASPSLAVGGVITSAGAPLPNATVVLPDGAGRRETRTDIGGRFRFDGVRASKRTPLFVDAGTGNDRRTAAFPIVPGTGLSLDLPVPPPDADRLPPQAPDAQFANCNVGDDQYPMVVPQSVPPGAVYDYSLNWNDVTMTVQSDRPGTYAFNVYATPFFFLQASVQVTSRFPATAPMTFIQPHDVMLQVLNNRGFMLPAGLELSFAPPDEVATWLDPTELDLSAKSTVFLPCVNINPLALYINDGRGNGCDGDLTLTTTTCTIFLPSDPSRPCACQ